MLYFKMVLRTNLCRISKQHQKWLEKAWQHLCLQKFKFNLKMKDIFSRHIYEEVWGSDCYTYFDIF